ncbi:hypothetical protein [Streptomyces sp. NPDC055886]
MTAELLLKPDLRPGQRLLDVGTGSGVTTAVACHICGDAGVVTLDRDRHLADSAAVRLTATERASPAPRTSPRRRKRTGPSSPPS